ncbi:hypothetical protein F2P56_031566 [Juglans regia]|uniref:Disease resistance RPP13-like protein 1 n=1 Tax=Juglans regia TaxID=51240 RepID=A0A833SQQ9_JUGRE|nr:hypothetical protein F2P56_031566 [Juglans regia]
MAGALVGGVFLFAVLQVLADKVASLLEDAEEKQVTKPDVRRWIDELKDAFYDAEDILDEIATDTLQRKLDAEFDTTAKRVRNSISCLNPFVKDTETKVEVVLETLEYLARQKDAIVLRDGVGGKQFERLPTTSLVEESHICGRNEDREKIIEELLSVGVNGKEMSVIAIVGMGGIGKTALTQFVYNDSKVKEHFNVEPWVCVSDEFGLFKIMKTILEKVTKSSSDTTDLDEIQVTLKEKLAGKRFLFVLNDVWNKNYVQWEVLSNSFKSGVQGSKVIVTTREADVALAMRAEVIRNLLNLLEEDCLSLFTKHAFPKGKADAYLQQEALGRQIVEKCGGLPLAIKTIGALLRSKLDVAEWDMILKSELWDLPIEQINVMPLLDCSNLTSLPQKMWKLLNLRHLDITSTGIKEMPITLDGLKCLQTLTQFVISKNNKSCIKEFRKLTNPRGKLFIRELQNVEFPRDARLKDRRYLEELGLEWNDDINISESQRTVLDNLQAYTNLKSLTIDYYGGKSFPDWVGHLSFSNMSSICLQNCKHCCSLPPLGQLPFLQNLHICEFDELVTVGPEFYGSGDSLIKPFSTLTDLIFENMLKWGNWVSFGAENGDGAFPNLEGLHIRLCIEVLLKELPTGLIEITIEGFDALEPVPDGIMDSDSCLHDLRIRDCSSLTCFPMHSLPSTLKTLEITYCTKLELPMYLDYSSIENVSLNGCESLRGFLPSLNSISICRCDKLFANRIRWGLQKLSSVRTMIIADESEDVESFPEVGLLPSSLTSLRICGFPKMKYLDKKGIQHLTSLEELQIDDCPKLKCMPEEGLPTSLSILQIKNCALLKKQWQRKKGKEWCKIAQVPSKLIDLEWIE